MSRAYEVLMMMNESKRIDIVDYIMRLEEARDAYVKEHNELERAKVENAKLRVLVRDLERARSALCDEYPSRIDVPCDECPAYDVCDANPIGRMRELGIEVDGWET